MLSLWIPNHGRKQPPHQGQSAQSEHLSDDTISGFVMLTYGPAFGRGAIFSISIFSRDPHGAMRVGEHSTGVSGWA